MIKDEISKASAESEWIQFFIKYKKIYSLFIELIDNLIDNIYICEGKKIRIKFKYAEEDNYLYDFIVIFLYYDIILISYRGRYIFLPQK